MYEEQRAVDALVGEVTRMFPRHSPKRIRVAVLDHWACFDGARVRDYLPVLVRLRVITDLHADS